VSKRSTVLIAIGMAVFIVGAGLVLVSLHGKGNSSPKKANLTAVGGSQGVDIVVTTAAVPAGTTGETMVEAGKVKLERVATSPANAGYVTSFAELQTSSVNHSLAAGTPIQTTDLSPSTGLLPVPAGDQSLTVTMNSAQAALAGYLQPGQKVNLYSNISKLSGSGASPANQALPCVTLVAPQATVLDVSAEAAPYSGSGGRTVPSGVTVLLAVTPQQAPAVVFNAMNESLFLVASDQTSVPASDSCYGYTGGGSVVPVP
jgi:Flp pilus assembly protein CpaB